MMGERQEKAFPIMMPLISPGKNKLVSFSPIMFEILLEGTIASKTAPF